MKEFTESAAMFQANDLNTKLKDYYFRMSAQAIFGPQGYIINEQEEAAYTLARETECRFRK